MNEIRNPDTGEMESVSDSVYTMWRILRKKGWSPTRAFHDAMSTEFRNTYDEWQSNCYA